MYAKRMSGMLSEVKKDQKSMLASVFSCVHKNKIKTDCLPASSRYIMVSDPSGETWVCLKEQEQIIC